MRLNLTQINGTLNQINMRKSILILIVMTFVFTSCEKQDICKEGLVTYKLSEYSQASIVSFLSSEKKSVVNLSGMNKDLTLNPSDATGHVIYTDGDLNLNGYKLTLNNVKLNIVGNFNGGGELVTKGNKGSYCMINGNPIQNNPVLSNAVSNCGNTLSSGSINTITRIGTECDLGRSILIGFDNYVAVEFKEI